MRARLAAAMLLATLTSASCAHSTRPTHPQNAPRLEVLGVGARITMAVATLDAGARLQWPVSRCQRVSLFVEEGAVSLPGQRVVNAGEAVQIGNPQNAWIETDASGPTQLFVVVARDSVTPMVDHGSWRTAPTSSDCVAKDQPPIYSADVNTGPFEHAQGRLKVQVLLDGMRNASPYNSLGILDADPDVAVPEHKHEDIAEVLYFISGSGSMRIGEASIPIKPGTFVYVPPDTLHGFIPDGQSRLFAYQVYAGPGPEQRFIVDNNHN